MKPFIQSLFFLLTPVFVLAQNFTGVVLEEETTVEITNAIVVIEGTALAQKTNEVGEFAFYETIPTGEQIVTVSKEGYETKYFIITVESGKQIVTDKIELEITREESKRRRKVEKEREKEAKRLAKEREEMIEKVREEKEDELKRLAKERRKLEKESSDVIISYNSIDANAGAEEISEVPEIDPVQVKYGEILAVEPSELINIELYKFIEDWTGTTYVMGGATKEGIDCSSFTQRLYTKVYDLYIERTAQKQFDSNYTDKFKGREFLKEGDLIFFGDTPEDVNHVGIYLWNNKFVHATARKGKSGYSGVKVSDLTDANWSRRFLAGGRRINNE